AQSLVALEGEGATESEIAALFRAVHTLKGAAYTVGCGMVGDLAHRVEDMPGQIREHQRPLDRAAIETVFAGLDALRLLVPSGRWPPSASPTLPSPSRVARSGAVRAARPQRVGCVRASASASIDWTR